MPSEPTPRPKPPENQTAAQLFPPDSKGISPYWPNHLIDIFIDPKQFFSPKAALGKPVYLVIAVLLTGLSAGISRIDQLLLETELGSEQNYWQELGPLLQSWPNFWITGLMGSAIVGALLWLVEGWIFRVRIKLSGDLDPDPQLARIVYIYSFLVRAIPHILLILFWTVTRSHYQAAYTQGMALTLLLTSAFSFGELLSAYTGVVTLFSVERDRARLWFVIAPAVVYAVSLAFLVSALQTTRL